jgi:hypothetical protein
VGGFSMRATRTGWREAGGPDKVPYIVGDNRVAAGGHGQFQNELVLGISAWRTRARLRAPALAEAQICTRDLQSAILNLKFQYQFRVVCHDLPRLT